MKKSNWIYKVFFMTFSLSIIFSFISNMIAYNASEVILFILLILIIIFGIIFDMIGTSFLTSKEASFHAMNSKKIKGANESLYLLSKKIEISNLCLDVIGDISGILSGSIGAVLAFSISDSFNLSLTMVSVIIGALVSSLTVMGKSIFKDVALKNADFIVFNVGKGYRLFKRK